MVVAARLRNSRRRNAPRSVICRNESKSDQYDWSDNETNLKSIVATEMELWHIKQQEVVRFRLWLAHVLFSQKPFNSCPNWAVKICKPTRTRGWIFSSFFLFSGLFNGDTVNHQSHGELCPQGSLVRWVKRLELAAHNVCRCNLGPNTAGIKKFLLNHSSHLRQQPTSNRLRHKAVERESHLHFQSKRQRSEEFKAALRHKTLYPLTGYILYRSDPFVQLITVHRRDSTWLQQNNAGFQVIISLTMNIELTPSAGWTDLLCVSAGLHRKGWCTSSKWLMMLTWWRAARSTRKRMGKQWKREEL